MFKICIIGCGDIATRQHGPAIKRYEKLHKDTLFAACCDVDAERAVAFKETFNLPQYYTNIDEMLEAEQPHTVSINVPVHITAALACKILAKGFPLISEKPPGLDSAETLGMIAAAKNAPNFVAFNRRHMPLVEKVMKVISSDDILDISYRMLRVNRQDPDFSTTAIHGIDLVKYITGADYKQVNFRYRELAPPVASFHMSCEMENGIITNLDFLPMSGVNTERLEINTRKGLFMLRLPIWAGCHDGAGQLIHFAENIKTRYEVSPAEEYVLGGFYRENELFFNALRDNEVCNAHLIESGLQSVEIADCIRKRRSTYEKS